MATASTSSSSSTRSSMDSLSIPDGVDAGVDEAGVGLKKAKTKSIFDQIRRSSGDDSAYNTEEEPERSHTGNKKGRKKIRKNKKKNPTLKFLVRSLHSMHLLAQDDDPNSAVAVYDVNNFRHRHSSGDSGQSSVFGKSHIIKANIKTAIQTTSIMPLNIPDTCVKIKAENCSTGDRLLQRSNTIEELSKKTKHKVYSVMFGGRYDDKHTTQKWMTYADDMIEFWILEPSTPEEMPQEPPINEDLPSPVEEEEEPVPPSKVDGHVEPVPPSGEDGYVEPVPPSEEDGYVEPVPPSEEDGYVEPVPPSEEDGHVVPVAPRKEDGHVEPVPPRKEDGYVEPMHSRKVDGNVEPVPLSEEDGHVGPVPPSEEDGHVGPVPPSEEDGHVGPVPPSEEDGCVEPVPLHEELDSCIEEKMRGDEVDACIEKDPFSYRLAKVKDDDGQLKVVAVHKDDVDMVEESKEKVFNISWKVEDYNGYFTLQDPTKQLGSGNNDLHLAVTYSEPEPFFTKEHENFNIFKNPMIRFSIWPTDHQYE